MSAQQPENSVRELRPSAIRLIVFTVPMIVIVIMTVVAGAGLRA